MGKVYIVEQLDRDLLTVRLWAFSCKQVATRFCKDLVISTVKTHKIVLSEVPLNNGHGLDTTIETFYGTR